MFLAEGGGCTPFTHSRILHRPPYPYNSGTERVGFLPTRLASRAPSAKCRDVFGGSHKR